MSSEVKRFKDEFFQFVHRDFGNHLSPWRRKTNDAFLKISLTPQQVAFLLDPENATTQFRTQFMSSINAGELLPQACLAASVTEPVNKIATYLAAGRDQEEIMLEAIRKAAAVLPAVQGNFRSLVNDSAPTEANRAYDQLGSFAKAAQKIVALKRLQPVRKIQELDGMHHVAPLDPVIFSKN